MTAAAQSPSITETMEAHKKTAQVLADEFWSGKRVERIPDVIHPDYVWHGPSGATAKGQDGYRALVDAFHAGFPDQVAHAEVMIAEGDWVATVWRIKGTHDGPMFGRPATHKKAEWLNLINLQFAEDGRIIQQIEMFDWSALMEQLGMTDRTGTDPK